MYDDVKIYYIDTGSHHPDNIRFKSECEKWFGQEIITLQSKEYKNVSDVIRKIKYVNGPGGAACTYWLKKRSDMIYRMN